MVWLLGDCIRFL